MAEPKVRFKRDDGSSYPTWKEYSISDLFTKIGNKNKDGQNTNVITNSAEFGLIPQRDYFDKDIAVEGNTGNYTIIRTGDFVYNPRKSSYAPMGPFNCYRLEEDGIVSPLYSCLRSKGVLNPEYLLWYFQTDKWYGYVNDHGAQNGARHDRVGMTDKILMGIPVTAPCEEEQQKIAAFLFSVDVVISTSEEEVANLETQKKAVMKKVFSQEVRFKRADGSDYPEWEEKSFENAFESLNNNTFSRDMLNYDFGTAFNIHYGDILVKYGEVCDIQAEGLPYVNEGISVSKYAHLQDGDIILADTAEDEAVGKAVEIINVGDSVVVSGLHTMVCRPKQKYRPKYLGYYMNSPAFHDQLKPYMQGIKVTSIGRKNIKDVTVMYPSDLEEQSLIADFLSDYDEAIEAAKKELELWKELKKGLLQQMFA